MALFAEYFKRALTEEVGMMSGGADGVFGAGGDTGGMFPGGSDSFATGDARIPDILGSKHKKRSKRKKKKGKKSRHNRKKIKNKSKNEQVNIQRRNLKRAL